MTEESGKRATFVLVHGAWHGGWCMKKIRALLQAAGHEVFTPTLTGLGERAHLSGPSVNLDTHVEDIVAVLECEDLHDVILVGHSYAGMVITGVAARAPKRLARLVYLDAFLPDDGRSLNDYVPAFVEGYERAARTKGDGWRLPFGEVITMQMLGITDPEDLAWMSPRMKDQPYETFRQPVKAPAQVLSGMRRVYLLSSSRPHYLAAAERAEAQGFTLLQVPGAGHDVMVTQPKELATALSALT
jgi:pimeloyl-ACP methyl ester carboxylesterase